MTSFAHYAAALLLALGAVLSVTPASAAESCDSSPLAERLYERLQGDGRSDADILDILGSGFKRGVLRGRVTDSSGCSEEQVEESLQQLETMIRE